MFGKRTTFGGNTPGVGEIARPVPSAPRVEAPTTRRAADGDAMAARMRGSDDVVDVRAPADAARDKEYFHTKSAIFNALIDSIDLSQLATMDQDAAREEIRDPAARAASFFKIL